MTDCSTCGDEKPEDRFVNCAVCRCNEADRRNRYRSIFRRAPRSNEWAKRAVCKDMDVNLFYPRRGFENIERYRQLRPLCDRCPVSDECLEDALYYESFDHEPAGFRGGKSAKERRAMLSARAGGRAGLRAGTG